MTLLDVVGTLLAAIVSILMFYFAPTLDRLARAKFGNNAVNALTQFAFIAVQAAEQALKAGAPDDKKDFALKMLEALTEKTPYNFSYDTMDKAIEAAVYQMKQSAPVALSAGELLSAPTAATVVASPDAPVTVVTAPAPTLVDPQK